MSLGQEAINDVWYSCYIDCKGERTMSDVKNETGVIAQIKQDRRGFKLENDVWYSCYKAAMLGSANVGDAVSFQWKANGDWKNVVGTVSVTGQAGPSAATSSASASPSATADQPKYFQKNLGYLVKSFPVPTDHPDRSIIRQNCLNHATSIVTHNSGGAEVSAADVVKMARMLEGYATGEDDADTIANVISQMEV